MTSLVIICVAVALAGIFSVSGMKFSATFELAGRTGPTAEIAERPGVGSRRKQRHVERAVRVFSLDRLVAIPAR